MTNKETTTRCMACGAPSRHETCSRRCTKVQADRYAQTRSLAGILAAVLSSEGIIEADQQTVVREVLAGGLDDTPDWHQLQRGVSRQEEPI